MAKISIEIDGRSRYASLLDLDQQTSGSLPLTTIGDRQSRALIKLFYVDDNRRELIKEFEVRGLSPLAAGEPRIQLRARFDGRRLSVNIYLEKRPYTSAEIDLKPYLPQPPFPWAWAILPVALVAIVLLGFYAFRQGGWLSTGMLSTRRSSSTSARSRPTPTQAPKPAAASPQTRPQETRPLTQQTPAAPPAVTVTPPSAPPSSGAVINPTRPAFGMTAVYFEAESATLTASARAELDRVATYLSEWPDTRVSISGHTALYGNEQGREALSVARAQNVVDYLRERGWQPIETPRVRGLAGSTPVSTVRTEQQLNRRVEISPDG